MTLKIIFTPELEPSGELIGMSGANVAGTLFKSAANGMINAFVTLRVGMPAVVGGGVKNGILGLKNLF